MNNIKVQVKKFSRDYLLENSDQVFRNRELVVEEDNDGIQDHTIYRFKIGDGITPYRDLKYISSLYTLFPEIIFYDNTYENAITLNFSKE